MKLSPAPTVSTTSTRGAATSMRSLPKMASAPRSPRVATQKRGPVFVHVRQAVLDRAAGVEPLEVLLASLDHVSERSLQFDKRFHRISVRGHERADVGIETDCRKRVSGTHGFDDGMAVPLNRGERADMQMPAALGPLRGKRPGTVVGSPVEIERISRTGLCCPPHHERQSRGPLVAHDHAKVDAAVGERAGESFAIAVVEIRETNAVGEPRRARPIASV